MALVKKRTTLADLYSINVLFLSNGRKPVEVDHETSLELLASHPRGYIPYDVAKRKLFTDSRAKIVNVGYCLPNGEVVFIGFKEYEKRGRPNIIDVRDTREVLFRNHYR